VLHSILKPVSEFEHGDKGDALYGMFLDLCSLVETVKYHLWILSIIQKTQDLTSEKDYKYKL
jgi:ferritin heavy chain